MAGIRQVEFSNWRYTCESCPNARRATSQQEQIGCLLHVDRGAWGRGLSVQLRGRSSQAGEKKKAAVTT